MKIYQVDAFAEKTFTGNPAAVIPLAEWLPDALMQQIAAENNLAETAFLIPNGEAYHLRWFTPTVEVDLCGHATLATAHVMMQHEGYQGDTIYFDTRSGRLSVQKKGNLLTLDFPVDVIERVSTPNNLIKMLGTHPTEVWRGRSDYLVLLDTQKQVEMLHIDFRLMQQLDGRGVICTAVGNEEDFVSRCFYPQTGIDEDPVTGSAHTTLTAFWAARTGKNQFHARQLSQRGGHVHCSLNTDRVAIAGKAVTYLIGEIFV